MSGIAEATRRVNRGLVRWIILAVCSAVVVCVGAAPAALAQEPGPDAEGTHICRPRSMSNADCEAAVFVYEWAISHNWSPPKNYVGNRPFYNSDARLPGGAAYKEYDIYPRPPANSGGRDAKRIVIDMESQRAWYTADHFASFAAFSYS